MKQQQGFTRRHFLLGSAAVAGSVVLGGCGNNTPSPEYRPADAASIAVKSDYPPALLGLRGDHEGSQSAAHSLALQGKQYTFPKEVEEHYDLVVVGAGISGLTAAYLYQKKQPQAKILIIDNHDDFGGHAKRNEFTVNGRHLITYGGSESLDSPQSNFSKKAHALLKELGVDYKKFHQYFQKDLYEKNWKLKRGIFFNQKAFGKNTVVLGDLEKPKGIQVANMINQFPLPDADKRALLAIYTAPRDYLKGKTPRQKREYAAKTSYYDFLKNQVGLPEKALMYLHNVSSEYWGHAINAISVAEALENGYPAVEKLGLPREKEEKEPYIYHFPDGNASIARLLVRKLIPDVAAGNSMEDVVTAKFDYTQLDSPEHSVCIRLNSTALLIENQKNQTVKVVYATRGTEKLQAVEAKYCVFAGHAALAARIMPQMPVVQRNAMKSNVKIPMLYAKVALKNARAFQKMGAYFLYAPAAPYCLLQLDDPVNIGDYRHASTPDEPIVLHAVRIASAWAGETARDKYRAGRAALLAQQYADLENELRAQLRALYQTVGENFDETVAGITINRWAHGYSYEQTQLWDSDHNASQTTAQMQKRLGHIVMAGSDVAWKPYVQDAIDQAYRAVQEIAR